MPSDSCTLWITCCLLISPANFVFAQSDYPTLIPDPGPSLYPVDPGGNTTIGGVSFSLIDSEDESDANFPNPPSKEDIFDSGVLIGEMSFGASYTLGPAAIINITNPKPNTSYSLLAGPHTLKYYGVNSFPSWQNGYTVADWEAAAILHGRSHVREYKT